MDFKNIFKTKKQKEAEAKAVAEAAAEKLRIAEERKAKRTAKKAVETAKKSKTPKDVANEKGEPWVEIVSMDIDPEDPGNGAFELDWNDIFVARLIKAGYQGKTDADIVDNWFQTVCRNVVMETYQQEMADPSNRPSNRRDLGNGRTEVS